MSAKGEFDRITIEPKDERPTLSCSSQHAEKHVYFGPYEEGAPRTASGWLL